MKGENLYSGVIRINNIDKFDISSCAMDYMNQKNDLLLTKDGMQTLLYEINNDSYKDLVRNKIYEKNQVIDESLVKLNNIASIGNRISKKKALKIYYESLKQKIDLNKIYIGDIAHVYKINKIEINGSVMYEPEYIILKSKRLILKENDRLIDLETYNEYYGKVELGSFIIVNLEPFIKEDKKLEKGLILEKYRKIF